MKKMAEERKRQKAEDRMARQKVREQIARDREEREASSQSVAVVQQQPSCDVKKDYSLCRLQVIGKGFFIIIYNDMLFDRSD